VRSSFDRPHVVKFAGNYLFAEPIGVNLGAFLRLQSGQERLRGDERAEYVELYLRPDLLDRSAPRLSSRWRVGFLAR